MHKRLMVVDGYNVIHRTPRWALRLTEGLEAARNALTQYCARWMRARKDVWRFYVVFDGDSSVAGRAHDAAHGVRAIYSRSGETADAVILDLVRERHDAQEIIVVSDDQEVMRGARAMRASVMSCATFAGFLGQPKAQACRESTPAGDKALSPAEEKAINDALMREWGLSDE